MSFTGQRRRKQTLPSSGIVHEGSLTKHGYNLEEGSGKREAALDRAVKDYGYRETVDKLAALEGVNKNRPELHAKVKADISYLQRVHSASK